MMKALQCETTSVTCFPEFREFSCRRSHLKAPSFLYVISFLFSLLREVFFSLALQGNRQHEKPIKLKVLQGKQNEKFSQNTYLHRKYLYQWTGGWCMYAKILVWLC